MSEILEKGAFEIYRHRKTGRHYEFIGEAKNKTDEQPEALVVYREFGKPTPLYTRSNIDFTLKFEKVSEAARPKDYTKSTETVDGLRVQGLFRDKQFIRGYVKVNGFWTWMTWVWKTGKYLSELKKSRLDLKL